MGCIFVLRNLALLIIVLNMHLPNSSTSRWLTPTACLPSSINTNNPTLELTSLFHKPGTISNHFISSSGTLHFLVPAPGLFDVGRQVILFARCGYYVYIPSHRRRLSHSITAALLLMSGIESNPSPPNSNKHSTTPIRMGLLNCRSAVNKAALVHDVIIDHKLDVMVLTETWVAKNAPTAVKLDLAPPGYVIIHAHRNTRGRKAGSTKSGGGIAVIHRSDISLRANPSLLGRKPKTFEQLSVTITAHNRRLNLVALYRPPPAPDTTFFSELSDALDSVELQSGETLFCGDFNCPGVTSTSIDPHLDHLLADHDLIQYIDRSTRGPAGNILDLVVGLRGGTPIDNVGIKEVGFSDHNLILFNISLPVSHPAINSFYFRDIKQIDPEHFSKIIQQSPIFMSPPADVNEFVLQFESDVKAALDQVAPMKKITKRIGSRLKAFWLSDEAKKAKSKARQLERRFKSTNLESDYVAYRKARRSACKSITQSRTNHFRDELKRAESVNDSRSRWRILNQLLHSHNKSSPAQPSDMTRLAASFTDFFANKLYKIQTNIAGALQATNIAQCLPFIPAHPTQSLADFPVVSESQVADLLRSLPAKSSPLDLLPTCLLKSCLPVFTPILTNLANLSFSQGVFPNSFKLAQITPLLKKPHLDPSDPSNYRPISNLKTLGKFLERLSLSTLRNHITSNQNFCRFQSAYRTGHSTETAVLKIVNDMYQNTDKGHPSLLTTIDLSAAFDTVNHQKLAMRLGHDFGLSGAVRKWVESYLENRQQFVKYGQASGAVKPIIAGVPQGSVLGPLLFAAYVSPIGRIIEHFGVGQHHYADDTTLYIRLDSANVLPSALTDCVDAISAWFLVNDMQVNPDKSEIMVLGSRAKLKTLRLPSTASIGGTVLNWSDTVKIIGVTLDSTLSFDQHVSEICQTSSYHIRALRHIRPYLNASQAAQLGCSIVSSRLDYCNSILSGTSAHNIGRLQRVQNNLARVICSTPSRASAQPLLQRLHWLPIQQRIMYKIAVLTHKTINHGQPSYLEELTQIYKPARSLRSSNGLSLVSPFVKTAGGEKAFSAAAPHVWNNLSLRTRTSTSLTSFKKNLKTELFTAAFLP